MRLIGLDEVTSDFEKAASTVGRRSADATRESAEDLADDARSFAAVLSGEMRDSIEVTEVEVTQNGAVFEVGPTVDYGGFVENGTSDTAPQPFMQPAADRQAPEYVKALEEVAGDI